MKPAATLFDLASAALDDLVECLEPEVEPARDRWRRRWLSVMRSARRRLEARHA